MKKTAYWGLSLLLMAALVTPGFAQDIKWKGTADYEAYMLVYNEKADMAKKAANAEKFLADFKDADPVAVTQVYQMMLLAYFQANNFAKAMETAEKLPQLVPNADNGLKTQAYQVGMGSAQNLKNNAKTVEYAEKLLGLNAKDISALLAMSGTLAAGPFATDEATRDTQVNKAIDYTKRALAEPKPAGLADAQWNPVQAQLHFTMCGLLYTKKQYPETIAECQQSLKFNSKDGNSFYYIGLAHKYQVPALQKKYQDSIDEINANRTADPITREDLKARSDAMFKAYEDKLDEAIDALAKSVAVSGPAQAKTELDALYKARNNNSIEGLDQLIAKKKTELSE